MSEHQRTPQNSRAKVSLGITMNLGNYEAARIDVGAEKDIVGDETFDDVCAKLRISCAIEMEKAKKMFAKGEKRDE